MGRRRSREPPVPPPLRVPPRRSPGNGHGIRRGFSGLYARHFPEMVTADEVQAELNALKLEVAAFKADVDMWYLVVMGVLVFFMQSGFALLEAGSVRAKNTKNILMKNLLDACIGALVFWAFGYSLAVRKALEPPPPR